MGNSSSWNPVRRFRTRVALGLVLMFGVAVGASSSWGQSPWRIPLRRNPPAPRRSPRWNPPPPPRHGPPARVDPTRALVNDGRRIFRYDTFGDEAFWGDALRLHEAVSTLSPVAALGLGLKVDVEALPPRLRSRLRYGQVDLGDPAVTLSLLKLDAVVGVKGFFSPSGRELRSIGIRCALCHSTVDDSLAPGVGRRLDGWANRDLNVGAVIAAAPDVSPFANPLGASQDAVRQVLRSWGPGRFDPYLALDGKAFRPDGKSGSVLIPPAFGLAKVDLTTATGWGSISYWNSFVAVLEMHAQGSFADPRINDPARFPIGAANGFFNVTHSPDLVTPKLPALRAYQHSLSAPRPPVRSFDMRQANRGRALFMGKANCASCHTPSSSFTDANRVLHTPQEIGIDDFQSERSPTRRYRTTPLRGLWTHMDGGFYHDGRFKTLEDVVAHYNGRFSLGLTDWEAGDLVEYLKSL